MFHLLITVCVFVLLQHAAGLVPCGLNGVGTLDGADGYFHVLDFVLTNQSLPTGSNVTVTFTLGSAFDNSSLACFGELISASMTMDPGGWVSGNCTPKDPNAALGDTPTNFSYGLTQISGNNDYQFRIDQKLQCQPSDGSRPRRASVTTDYMKVYPDCNASRSRCTLAPLNGWVYSGPLLSAAPLTECAARSLDPAYQTWTITNVSYFSFNAPCIWCIYPGGPAGDVFVNLYIAPLDFSMRCSPSSTELSTVASKGSESWFRCDVAWDIANAPETPPTWMRFDQFAWTVELRQEWNCTDAGGDVTYFEGAGNTTLPSACDNDSKASVGRNIECWSTAIGKIRPNVTVVKG